MSVSLHIPGVSVGFTPSRTRNPQAFPLNLWYVAALSKEVNSERPLARRLLNEPVVLFRTADGAVAAVEDRCCHRHLPLSNGTLEADGIRCGYHGMLYNREGQCTEIPGQDKVPAKARVHAYVVQEVDSLVWIWFGSERDSQPDCPPPSYPVHSSPEYAWDGDVFHYQAPFQLIHDNLLDLSHLGYVHLKTIGGNASIHMNAEQKVEANGNEVLVKRYMRDSVPPPTYTAVWPFAGKVDRWQEILFTPNHLRIWTGAVDVNTDDLDDPERGGFHMRGYHAITPETETSSHYLWTMATNPQDNREEVLAAVIQQTAFTFQEDKVVIEAQYNNMKQFAGEPMVDIHVDVGPNRARRIMEQLKQ